MEGKFEFDGTPKIDLNNEDDLIKLFENGSENDLKKIMEYHNFNHEQVELFSHFAKMRRGVLNEMTKELYLRRANNPVATKLELDMGAYQENIEPQVREIVNNLRGKGYTSYESGFAGFDSQLISFEENHLQDFYMPAELIDSFNEQGVIMVVEPNSVRLTFKKRFSKEEISNFWKEVEKYLPNTGQSAKPCQLDQAIMFREKQKKY